MFKKKIKFKRLNLVYELRISTSGLKRNAQVSQLHKKEIMKSKSNV